MKWTKLAWGGVLAVVAAAAITWQSLDKETRGFLAALPTNTDVLFWQESQRDAAFRALDRLPVLAQHRVVAASGKPAALPPGPPLALPL
ncbi:MAG: serine hydrolase, partial [Burkholderiales bacterium]|nr:serine hydrolase [Burkholderiales bacterium]